MALIEFKNSPDTSTPLSAENLNYNFNYSVPTGGIVEFVGTTAPNGWLLCDGSAISRTEYADLFGVIGTTFGLGDGSTTFNLPNFAGKVPIGVNVSDEDFNSLGKTGGEKTHTLTVAEIPSHQHNVLEANAGGYAAPFTEEGFVYQASNIGYWSTTRTDFTGGGQAHNNLQPYIVVNYIIKF